MAENKKKSGLHLTIGAITLVLGVLALVLFLLSFTTNYYTFGSLKSPLILTLILGGLVLTALSIWLHHKFPRNIWVRFVPFAVIACFAAAAMLLVGDRVEGIGTCIMTDYDSGHGGEEAIYMSLASSVLMLIAVVYNIIGCFHADPTAPGKKRNLIYSIVAAVLVVAVAVATIMLTGVLALNGKAVVSDGQGGYAAMRSGTYTVSFNQNSGNVDLVQGFEFIPGTTKGLLNYDSRLFLDLTLSLDGAGSYELFAESYAMEAGKRCEIGDDTGLGMILTTKAEGTYVDNGDGTVTTSPATHAVAEFRMDTYSVQMKDPASIAVGEHKDEGSYDSAEYPEVLDLVPETRWTLADGAIVKYGKPALGGTYTVSFNQNSGNVDLVQDFEFIPGTTKGLLNYDSRLFLDLTLSLDGAGSYTLFAESYAMEAGKRCEIGDDTGLGMILTTKAEGTYVDNGDGTVTTSPATHAVAEFRLDTYSVQMKDPASIAVGEHKDEGSYDSAEYPEVLDLVPETVWTLADGAIVSYLDPNVEEASEEEPAAPAEESGEELSGVEILSDDGATRIVFYPTGTYEFCFDQYSISDPGSYAFVDGVLTLTDANGVETTAEGDPLLLHYTYSQNDALTGDFTIPAEKLAFQAAESSEESGEELSGAEILSDDGATRIVFYPTGTYEFCFDQYNISDPGSYAFVDGVLTLTDANGAEITAEGDPLLLHYTYSQNEALTGDFTIPAEKLAFQAAESSEESGEELSGAEILSDDGATRIVFYPTGTYEFCFDQYNISDPGSYAFVDGVLTLTDANGVETTAEGDPLLLHYTYSQNEALTGDFTIPAEKLAFQAAEELRSATILSDDEGTKMTFNSDGTYKFAFESYGIEDLGTWTYVDGVLTLTDVNGLQYTAEGEPLHLHYGYSGAPDQLTGEYTIPADTFDFEELLSLTVVSDDRGTTMSFNSDGTYRFWFEPYQVEDLGAWQIADGLLTLTDANGVEIQAEGAPYKLHYVYSQNDALTGDFTIPVGIFPFPVSGTSIPSDDFGTGMTFFADGTYLFTFDSYSILDAGTWTFEDGVLTLTDANGVEYSADGETLHLHYGYSGAPDQLTGDFTIDPAIFAEKTEQ